MAEAIRFPSAGHRSLHVVNRNVIASTLPRAERIEVACPSWSRSLKSNAASRGGTKR